MKLEITYPAVPVKKLRRNRVIRIARWPFLLAAVICPVINLMTGGSPWSLIVLVGIYMVWTFLISPDLVEYNPHQPVHQADRLGLYPAPCHRNQFQMGTGCGDHGECLFLRTFRFGGAVLHGSGKTKTEHVPHAAADPCLPCGFCCRTDRLARGRTLGAGGAGHCGADTAAGLHQFSRPRFHAGAEEALSCKMRRYV